MSIVAIRSVLESRLEAGAVGFATATQNVTHTPAGAATPYQKINLIPAEPDNSMASASFWERGIFQVTLCYPVEAGTGAAEAKADAIRTLFKRNTTMTTAGGIRVIVTKTPKIAAGFPDGDRWCVPVSVPWHAFVS